MRQRGKKSAASLTIIQGDFERERPEPPPDLTPAQADLWRRVVRDEPADFFSTEATREMLKDYCRQRGEVDRVSKEIDSFKSEWFKKKGGPERYKELMKMRDYVVRGATTLATKLRITNQSRHSTKTAGVASRNASRGIKPWEI